MEIAKKEQVARFSKIAAPSGLLNGLNPGIINHLQLSHPSGWNFLIRHKGRLSDTIKKGLDINGADKSEKEIAIRAAALPYFYVQPLTIHSHANPILIFLVHLHF
ncbi:hypothetical protein GIB67_011396 [Kingdonia uniflora]|uniref:Uncharacterized protein n=1 Tax=Kingdonia uniflora TaxID=39325 RepID=A0A7J7PB11_9MAGN|nr:hypothetical protein GIB67_011396 [Kingdonia uniflora]